MILTSENWVILVKEIVACPRNSSKKVLSSYVSGTATNCHQSSKRPFCWKREETFQEFVARGEVGEVTLNNNIVVLVLQLTFIKQFISPRHCAKHFKYISPFNSHSGQIKWVLSLSSLYR